jgi:uncharacterized membrane protein
MMNKPWEYWAVVVAMCLYAATRDAEKAPLPKRIGKIVASGLLAIGLSPVVAPWVGGSEELALVAVMGFGILVLDIAVALLMDRQFIKDLITARIGGSRE